MPASIREIRRKRLEYSQTGTAKFAVIEPYSGARSSDQKRTHAMGSESALQSTVKDDVRERFHKLATEWKAKSRHLSNSAQMAMLMPYHRIIAMGEAAVPLILDELQREPDQWFWALEAITGQNPVSGEVAGKVRLMADAWVQWGKDRGLVTQ